MAKKNSEETSYAILGMGRFGRKVALPLSSVGADILVADVDEKKINEYAYRFTHAVVLDLTDVKAMRKIGLDHIDTAIVDLSHHMEAAVMAIMVAKESGVKKVFATASSSHGAEILRRVGADEVIIPDDEAAMRIAKKLISEDFMEYYDLGGDMCVIKIHPPEKWVGHTIEQLDLRKHRVNIIAIENDGEMNSDFSIHYTIQRRDTIVLATKKEVVYNFV